MAGRTLLSLLLLAAALHMAYSQQIRNYTAKELYPGQICADDGPAWEKLWIGICPQGYNGLRQWARANNKTGTAWPYCEPCKKGTFCFEFKPGVGKCVMPAAANSTSIAKNAVATRTFLKEGDVCLDFSGGKTKWKAPNPVLFAKSCQWPFFSCNMKGNDIYTCQRVRDAKLQPSTKCYRAAGSRWWGGTDQVYYWNDKVKQFKPCGGPNTEYPKCESWCKA